MKRHPRIALLIESSRGFGRGLLSGVAAYARTAGPWTFYHEPRSFSEALPARIRDWSPDGIIARIEHPKLADQLTRLKLPTVDLFEKRMLPSVPSILPDHKAIASLAAEHLLSLGLRHFAFCGFPGIEFSEARCRCFSEYLHERGYSVDIFGGLRRHTTRGLTEIEAQVQQNVSQFAGWLQKLPSRRCGFSHAETMYRLFKRVTGNTPGQYRSSLRRGR